MTARSVLENALYLLALLNPASKIMFLTSYNPALSTKETFELSWKSSAAALAILTLMAVSGNFILSRVFRIELYSLQITGGAVVFMIGWIAVREGSFSVGTPKTIRQNFTDISLVPLAAPLIAGPGMIAAAITMNAQTGSMATFCALFLAVTVNFSLMVFAGKISLVLGKYHLTGPLIRLTGLIIAAVAVQMIVSGAKKAFL